MIKALIATTFFLTTGAPLTQIANNVSNNNFTIKQKEDIGNFVFEQENNIFIGSNEKEIRTSVYLNLASKYKEYQLFFLDVMKNEWGYTIIGDDFKVPETTMGDNYNIIILCNDENTNFQGLTSINVTLKSKTQTQQLGALDKYFLNSSGDKLYLNLGNFNLNSNHEEMIIKEEDVLIGLDSFFKSKGEELWIKNPGVLISEKDNLDIKITNTHNEAKASGFYEIKVLGNISEIFEGELIAYVKADFNYKTINENINHEFGSRISANWSTVMTNSWENNNKWFQGINLNNYLTAEEKALGKEQKVDIFLEKYNELSFAGYGWAEDYNGDKYSHRNINFSLKDIFDSSDGLKVDLIKFKMNGFGVYSEAHSTISVKINEDFIFEYSLSAWLGVQGFGHKWQHTELGFSFSGMTLNYNSSLV